MQVGAFAVAAFLAVRAYGPVPYRTAPGCYLCGWHTGMIGP